MTRVSVVIPCRNENAYIRRCVEALIRQTYPSSQLTIIVVDGMSDDGTRDILEELKKENLNLVVLDNQQKVTPVALNLGIQHNQDEVKIILGAHSEVYPDFVSKNVEVLNAHPECDCCGGWWENVYANSESQAIGMAMSSPFGVGDAHYRTSWTEGYVDTVGFGAYRKRVFDAIGYFDEDLVRNQDDDFNYRLTQAGMKIWLSGSIRCKYFVRASFSKLARQQYQYGYWKVFVNRKHGTITTLRQVVPAIFVAYLILLVLFSIIAGSTAFWMGIPLLAYIAIAVVEATRMCLSSKSFVVQIPRICAAFFTLHVGYGLGYLRGIFHFLVLRADPSSESKTITR